MSYPGSCHHIINRANTIYLDEPLKTRTVVWLYILSRRVPLVEQKFLTLTASLNSLAPCYGSRVAHFLVFFCVMFCRLCLSFVGHCVVGLSIYGFWLPHCYGHTFLGRSPPARCYETLLSHESFEFCTILLIWCSVHQASCIHNTRYGRHNVTQQQNNINTNISHIYLIYTILCTQKIHVFTHGVRGGGSF